MKFDSEDQVLFIMFSKSVFHKKILLFYSPNKARNSHKPRLGEYVQQGNISSITYIVRGGSFLSFIQKIALKKHFEKKLVFKYLGSDEVEKKSF